MFTVLKTLLIICHNQKGIRDVMPNPASVPVLEEEERNSTTHSAVLEANSSFAIQEVNCSL
jgi:hypothetical protein